MGEGMRKAVFCSVIVGFLLLTTPVFAAIQAALDTPDDGQEVDGKSLISGWTYSDLDPNAAITVTLRINGTDTSDTIPCCVSRLDVQTAHPGAPPNTGFGRLQNYGIFNPATLTSIGVKITIQGEPQPRIIDHQVIVVKPGARSSDADPTLFSFLSQLSINGAKGVFDGEELIMTPVTVTDSGTGGTRKATLRLLWAANTQTFGVIKAASSTSFDDSVQAIFTAKCATSGCHQGAPKGTPACPPPDNTTLAQELDLSQGKTPGKAFTKLVPAKSHEDPTRLLVNPGKSSASYLYQKIISGGMIAGTRMPPACANNSGECLSADETQVIASWIDEGAPPPQQ